MKLGDISGLDDSGLEGRRQVGRGLRVPWPLRWLPVWLLALSLAAPALLANDADAGRLVAIGDIHGDFESLTTILKAAELIDERGAWSGGSATLVQTGDFVDRGPSVRKVMDLLRRLQREAPLAGGRVVVLLGNHEAMNLLGFRHDVNPEAYREFVDLLSNERQNQAWREYRRWSRERQRLAAQPGFVALDERTWRQTHPLGFVEYGEAIGVGGEYGEWLRALPMVERRGTVVFVHGGISASLSSSSLEELNERAQNEVVRLDRCRDTLLDLGAIVTTSEPQVMISEGLMLLGDIEGRMRNEPRGIGAQLEQRAESLRDCVDYERWFLVDETGPLWYRGYARLDEDGGLPLMEQVLDAYGVSHLVVGHTPQSEGRIRARWSGRVLLIDTGMLHEVYAGSPSALEIEAGRFTAIYPDGRQPIAVASPARDPSRVEGDTTARYLGADGRPLPFADEEQIVSYLAGARVIESRRLDSGSTRPYRMLLEQEGIQVHAIFREVDISEFGHRTTQGRLIARYRDSYRYEPAAYRLSRLIGLDRVPPAVLRTVDRRPGSLQLWIYRVFDDKKRLEQDLQPPVPRVWVDELAMRRVFDQLIDNFDRNVGNTLIDERSWRMWLIDHTRAFTDVKALTDPQSISRCARHVYEALVGLDLKTLEAHLGAMLDRAELEALEARRQELVEVLRGLIAARGEAAVLFDWPAP